MPESARQAVRDAIGQRTSDPLRERAGADWVAWCAPSAWAGEAEGSFPLERSGWTGTGALRLDDRDSLDARLRDADGQGERDDAALAWRSFAAWGDAAPAHWLGDYALAAIAPARDRIVIARGTLGVLHCFHADAGTLVVVADDPAVVAAVPGVDGALDERAVAEYLATGELVTAGLSFRRGVARVPAAHTVVIHRDGRAAVRRHWSLPVPEPRAASRPEVVVEEFRHLLSRAVHERLRSRSSVLMLSGGLDSALLASIVGPTGGQERVRALTVSWRSLLPADDEARWAGEVAASTGLDHEVLEMMPGIGFGPIAGDHLTPEPAPDPEPAASRAVARRAAAVAPVALLGEDPDTLLFPQTLADQFRTAGVRETLASWRAYRALTGRRPWIGWPRRSGALERWRDRRARRAPRWVRAELLARHSLSDVPPARPHPLRPLAARALSQPGWENSLWNDAPQMSGATVQVLLPYMDPRVIAFIFALPNVPWAQRKHLIRESLRSRVPPAVVERAKTPLRGYYEARVARWRAAGAPAPLPASVDQWVDVARWRVALGASARPDDILAAFRVCELSRWLAQPSDRAG